MKRVQNTSKTDPTVIDEFPIQEALRFLSTTASIVSL